MTWITDYEALAAQSDQLVLEANHTELLAAGLFGECGSVIAELKKARRDRNAYPEYQHKMVEEIGDFLWYYVRLVREIDPQVLLELPMDSASDGGGDSLSSFLELGSAVGKVLSHARKRGAGDAEGDGRESLVRAWRALEQVSRDAGVDLQEAATQNIAKVESRWPRERVYQPLFDDDFPEEEQIPRQLSVEFRDRKYSGRNVMVLRCNGLNFGDRLTDNTEDPDGYRYHDVFHFSYAVHLGWSPVIRSLLRCKRKSHPDVDESQDGARARVVEEGLSAIVFSRARRLSYFEGIETVDYNLLKTVSEFVQGFEVDPIPLWQWETAILDGFKVFRLLRANRGGSVELDLERHLLSYTAPPVR